MKDIVIHENRMASLKLLLAAVVMVASSCTVFYVGIMEEHILFSMIGGLGSLFFGVCLLVQVGRVIRRKPLFTIKWNGIEDTGSLGAMGFIPFDEIGAIVLGNNLGRKSIGISLCDVESYISKLTPMKQRIVRMNLSKQFPPVLLRVDSLKGREAQEVFEQLSSILEQYRNQGAFDNIS